MAQNSSSTSSSTTQPAPAHGPAHGPPPAAVAESTTQPARPLQKSSLTKRKYIDYDLSQLTDSKGGYLVSTRPATTTTSSSSNVTSGNNNATTGRVTRRAAAQNPLQAVYLPQPPAAAVTVTYSHTDLPNIDTTDAANNARCLHCQSLSLDVELLRHFDMHVCRDCRLAHPDAYTLLTKTECRQDYLLTDEELRDPANCPCMSRPNPLKSSYADMKLYLRCQVEQFAWKKWGDAAGLDAEWERRQQMKVQQEEQRRQKKMADLRRRTRTSLWTGGSSQAARLQSGQHQHDFIDDDDAADNADSGVAKKRRCRTCGMSVEEEEF